jgi:hypothetical protein
VHLSGRAGSLLYVNRVRGQLATEGISAAMQQSSSWSLGVDETERLFEQIARVKSEGVGGGHEEKKAG